jgi:hypothetical protein
MGDRPRYSWKRSVIAEKEGFISYTEDGSIISSMDLIDAEAYAAIMNESLEVIEDE